MKKSSAPKSPLTILITGLMVIAVMGGVVSWMFGTKPIMKLKPALEKLYNQRGFRCWIKINDGRIEIEPPPEFSQDRLARRRLGSVALGTYLKFTKYQSSIQAALVLPPRDGKTPQEEVTIAQMEFVIGTESVLANVAQDASVAAGSSATVTLVAPGFGGTALVVDVSPGDEAAAARAGSAVLRSPQIAFARIQGRSGTRPIEMGRELAEFATAPITSQARR